VRARGIDPGTAAIGWCDIERESAGVYRWIAHGVIEPKEIVRGGKMPIDDYGIGVFAVETPEEMHANDIVGTMQSAIREAGGGSAITTGLRMGAGRIVKKMTSLLETRAMAERISGLLVQLGKPIVEPTAAECRRALGVRFGAQRGKGVESTPDQQVKEKLHLYIRGWPARSNVHVRDAGAAAYMALVMAKNAAEVETAVRLALAGARS
jgi:hypothetical protein